MPRDGIVLKCSNVTSHYVLGDGVTVRAVEDANIEVRRGEILGIAGESGCGKTTLMRTIYRDVAPPLRVVSGKVELFTGEDKGVVDIYGLGEEELRRIRVKEISYIPQGSMSVLNPTSRIRDAFLEIYGKYGGVKKSEALSRVKERLRELGLRETVLNSYPHQLSGGMRQRAVIALATIMNPKVVLADEPTSALDVVYQRGVVEMILNIREMYGTSFILVSHDMGLHYQVTERLGIMYAGKIIEVGGTEEIFNEPLHPYTEGLINSLPRIGGPKRLEGLSGLPPNLANPPPGCRFHPRCPYRMDRCVREEPPLIHVKGREVACWLLEGGKG